MKSEKRTTVYFEASSADRLCELLGAYDENLKTLSAELGEQAQSHGVRVICTDVR